MESEVPRLDALESRLLVLEKRDETQQEENLSLRKELSRLKKAMKRNGTTKRNSPDGGESDLEQRMNWLEENARKTSDQLFQEMCKVETVQKVFNRMLINGHKNDLKYNAPCMQVFVAQSTGERETVYVEPSHTISHLKCLIEHKTGVSPAHQVLMFGDTELVDDDSTLENSEIEDNSVINLSVENGMQVSVVQSTGEKVTVCVEPSHTISHLKSVVQRKTGVSPLNQVLMFDDIELFDGDKTMDDSGIDDNSVLSLSVEKGLQVFVVRSTGEKKVTVYVEPSDTISHLKSIIQRKTGVQSPFQVLKFGTAILEPEDETVEDFGIEDSSVISLVVEKGMQVSVVQSTGEKLTVCVEPSHTISHLKSVVQRKTGVSPLNQVLMFDDTELVDDDETMDDSGIEENSVLSLSVEKGIQVFIDRSTGEKVTVCVELSHTISHLKSVVQRKTGVSPAHQVLMFDDTKLVDNNKTLNDIGIMIESVISLKVKQSSWEILVKTNERKEMKFDVGIRTTVFETRCMIHNKMEIPSSEHRALLFSGQELEDTKLLVEYGIGHDSTLDLVLEERDPTPKERIKILIGKNVLDVPLSTSVLRAKRQILPLVRSDRHVLKFKDVVLDSKKMLSDYGITSFAELTSSVSPDTLRQTVKVSVKSFSSQWSHDFIMDFWNSVGDLKSLIQDNKHVPVHSQTLVIAAITTKHMISRGYANIASLDFNPRISFPDVTTLSSILLDPQVISVVQERYDGNVGKGKPRHNTEINQTFSLPYLSDKCDTAYAKCESDCSGGNGYPDNSLGQCKSTIHIHSIDFLLV